MQMQMQMTGRHPCLAKWGWPFFFGHLMIVVHVLSQSNHVCDESISYNYFS